MIRICTTEDYDQICYFIHNYWKNNHILSNNKELLDFQHFDKNNSKYNFIASFNEENKINALLGFIPVSQYDNQLNFGDYWLAIWKVNIQSSDDYGIGLSLFEFFVTQFKPRSIGAIGINNEVKKIYTLLKFKTGVLNHFIFFNNKKKEFSIISVNNFTSCIVAEKYIDVSYALLSNLHDSPIELDKSSHPTKSITYYENRYFNHPIYKYNAFGFYLNKELRFIFITRKICLLGTSCLRIVDIIGDQSNSFDISECLNDILLKEDSEYIDCLNFGINEQYFFRLGFSLKDATDIIPNYFEPFEKRNSDIQFAIKTDKSDYIIFKGDSDQDRPNQITNSLSNGSHAQ